MVQFLHRGLAGCENGGMADAADSKSAARKGVWVQVPLLVLIVIASVAQLAEQLICNQQVVGSSPTAGFGGVTVSTG